MLHYRYICNSNPSSSPVFLTLALTLNDELCQTKSNRMLDWVGNYRILKAANLPRGNQRSIFRIHLTNALLYTPSLKLRATMEGISQNSEFGFLLQQASALKTQQLQQDRRRFEAFPSHVQHTLYHILESQDEAVRSDLHLTVLSRQAVSKPEKLEVFHQFKSLATDKFKDGDFMSAIGLYERAIGCFTYLTSSSIDWKTKGIKDEDIELHEYFLEDVSIQKLKAICLSNIATCYYNMGPVMAKNCIEACDCALAMDDTLSKAYFRRARARVLPASSGAVELEAALKDARKAAKLAPKSRDIRQLCSELLEQKAKQKRADAKTFQGLFKRRQLDFREEQGQNIDPNIGQVAMFKELSRMYEKRGKMKEAREIYEAAENASNVLKDKPEKEMDWDNPSEQMINDAASYGLDLKDPLVQEELKRLQKIEKDGGNASEDQVEGGTLKIMDRQLDTSIIVGVLVAAIVVCLRFFV